MTTADEPTVDLGIDLNYLVKTQAEQIAFLMRQHAQLKRENAVLKAALTRQTLKAGKTFRELRSQFDTLAEQIYDIILYWTKKLQRPLTYDEIIRYYRVKHPNADYASETICRRVRELAEGKIAGRKWLHSPTRGTFVPIGDVHEPQK